MAPPQRGRYWWYSWPASRMALDEMKVEEMVEPQGQFRQPTHSHTDMADSKAMLAHPPFRSKLVTPVRAPTSVIPPPLFPMPPLKKLGPTVALMNAAENPPAILEGQKGTDCRVKAGNRRISEREASARSALPFLTRSCKVRDPT